MEIERFDRRLGLYSATMISLGTMIGSAIFVLHGETFQAAGPSASLANLLAGAAAFFTAFAFCELVTFIPKAGGGYAYVRDAVDNDTVGFIAGLGFMLAYAISSGLFAIGFGIFLNYFLPFIPSMVGAYAIIIYVMITNIRGIENTGNLQKVITTLLIVILLWYIIHGVFHMNLSLQTSYFPEGFSGTAIATGFLYITFIGFGLVTTAAEEVIEPKKNIPRAILISLAFATVLKTAVFLVGSSIIHWEQLVPAVTNHPFTDVAVEMAGAAGGYIFAIAGIVATVSSINTAMLASSRTSFAMSRDQHLPSIFRNINDYTKTPIFSVLVAALMVILVSTFMDLRLISDVSSILILVGFSFVNLAVILFRKKKPNVKRSFKVPGYPATPILGILINGALISQLLANLRVTIMIAAIIFGGLGYYLFIKPKLSKRSKGITTQPIPDIQVEKPEPDKGYTVLTPIANFDYAQDLALLSSKIVCPYEGRVIPLHVTKVPEILPLDFRGNQYRKEAEKYRNIAEEIRKKDVCKEYVSEPISISSRDVPHAIKIAAEKTNPNLVLVGWHKSGFSEKMLGGTVQKVMEQISHPISIYKIKDSRNIKRILYLYGGGRHSQHAADLVKRVAEGYGAEVVFLRVVDRAASSQEKTEVEKVLRRGLEKLDIKGDTKIIESNSFVEEIVKESQDYDMIVMGISTDWGVKKYLTGKVSDKIMDRVKCNGLIVRGPKKVTEQKQIFRRILSRIKKALIE
ncbi:MAG: amino acid permease [Candidatus Hadarchaeia archaeon]